MRFNKWKMAIVGKMQSAKCDDKIKDSSKINLYRLECLKYSMQYEDNANSLHSSKLFKCSYGP